MATAPAPININAPIARNPESEAPAGGNVSGVVSSTAVVVVTIVVDGELVVEGDEADYAACVLGLHSMAYLSRMTRAFMLADFHVCLAECLGNRLLTSMMVDLSARTTLVSALYQSATEAQDSNEDHADIVNAIAAGNMKKAADLMRNHIDQLEKRLDDRFVQSGTSRERMLAKLVEPGLKSLKVKL